MIPVHSYILQRPTLKEFVRVAIINKRLKANKPASISLEGESGAGKTFLSLLIGKWFMDFYGSECDLRKHVVYTPSDFEKVVKHVFFEKCDLPLILVQETVSFAPSWWHPMNPNNPANKIYQILVLSREVRPVAVFINEQEFYDLYAKLRYRMNFLFRISRYVTSEGESLPPVVKVFEKVRMRNGKYAFTNPIIRFNGRRMRNVYFEVPLLREDNFRAFMEIDREFKEDYIRRLLGDKDKKKESSSSKEKQGKWLICENCGHVWLSRSKRSLKTIQCHMCNKKGMVRKATKQEIEDYKSASH